MNIDNLTYGELKQIAALFGQQKTEADNNTGLQAMVGKKCIVRTYSAGVWFGEIEQKTGNEVIVKNARRLWQWKAAESISLSAVAVYGVDAAGCRFAPAVESVWLEAIELIPASEGAIRSIESVSNVKAQ